MTARRTGLAWLASLSAAFAFATPAQAFVPGPNPMSVGSGSWDSGATWLGGAAPDDTALATISSGHTVTLTQDETVGQLTIEQDATLNLGGHRLTVDGLITLNGATTGGVGHPANVSSASASSLDAQCIDAFLSTFTNVAVAVTDAASCTQTAIFRSTGGTTWSGSTYAQTGGNASLGAAMSGVSPSFAGTSMRFFQGTTISGTLTLTGTGPVQFLPSSTDQPADPPMVQVGALAATGSHVASVDWSGLSPEVADGDRVNLLGVGSGTVAGLTGGTQTNTTFGQTVGNDQFFAVYDAPSAPSNTAAPSVTSTHINSPTHSVAGDTLTCGTGTWTGATSYAYVWKRDGAPTGATTADLTLTTSDVGHAMSCAVTATGPGGPTSASSSNSVTPVAVPTVDGAGPGVTSNNTYNAAKPVAGNTATCSAGTWVGQQSVAYAWKLGGTLITGESGATIAVTAAMVDKTLACRVTVTNAFGASASAEAAFAVGAVPVPAVAPTLVSEREGDTANEGDTLGCALGYWEGAERFVHQWLSDGTPIDGATGPSYVVRAADRGRSIACQLTGENGFGATRVVTRSVVVSTPSTSTPTPTPMPTPTAKAPLATSIPLTIAEAGTTVERPVKGSLSPEQGVTFRGPLAAAWVGDAGASTGRVRFTVPKKAGTYTEEVVKDGAVLFSFEVRAFTADSLTVGTKRLGVDKGTSLRCGTKYGTDWWVDGRPVAQHRGRLLDLASLPGRPTAVMCRAVMNKKGDIVEFSGVVHGNVLVTASVAGGGVNVNSNVLVRTSTPAYPSDLGFSLWGSPLDRSLAKQADQPIQVKRGLPLKKGRLIISAVSGRGTAAGGRVLTDQSVRALRSRSWRLEITVGKAEHPLVVRRAAKSKK